MVIFTDSEDWGVEHDSRDTMRWRERVLKLLGERYPKHDLMVRSGPRSELLVGGHPEPHDFITVDAWEDFCAHDWDQGAP